MPCGLGFAALQMIPLGLPAPSDRDFGTVLESSTGRELLSGNWPLFALIVALFVFNTVLGEELLFRGILLPRMGAAFGRADWIVNAVLFGLYHVSQPWSIPQNVVAGGIFAYATRRFRSAWMGIIVHSTQSVVLAALVLALVVQ